VRAVDTERRTAAWLQRRLANVLDRSDLGIPRAYGLERAATRALQLEGLGGRVDLDNPMSVRRAVTLLEDDDE
jgi:hypothetical protein